MALTGTIKKFMEDKGFGFITPDDGSEDVFIHIKQCSGTTSLEVGAAVTYDSDWNARNGKMQGKNCTMVGGDGGGGGWGERSYQHKSYRKVSAAGLGRTRTKSKPVLPDDHPLVLKRKADNAAKRTTERKRQKRESQ